MKKMFQLLVTISTILILGACETLPDFTEEDDGEFISFYDARINHLMDAYNVPGADIALIRNHEIVFNRQYGVTNTTTETAVDEGTLFRMGTLTKTMTATAVMHLIENTELELDSRLYDHMDAYRLEDSEFNEESITIRQLLSHTAGLTGEADFRHYPPDAGHSVSDILDGHAFLERAVMVHPAGEMFEYTYHGYLLLELLITDLSGLSSDAYVDIHILSPLGMDDTTYSPDAHDVASSHDISGNPLSYYAYPYRGPSGLFSTAHDTAVFFNAFMHHERNDGLILSMEGILAMHDGVMEARDFYGWVSDETGLGFFVEHHDNALAVFHTGEGEGAVALAYIYPETGDGIVVMTNGENAWPFVFTLSGDFAPGLDLPVPTMAGLYHTVHIIAHVVMGLLGLYALYKLVVLVYIFTGSRLKIRPALTLGGLLEKLVPVILLVGWFYVAENVLGNLSPLLQFRFSWVLIVVVMLVFTGSFFEEEPEKKE